LLYDVSKELQRQIDLEKTIKNPSLVYEHNIGEHTQGDLRILKLDDGSLLSFN
jgi:hypothetical protein